MTGVVVSALHSAAAVAPVLGAVAVAGLAITSGAFLVTRSLPGSTSATRATIFHASTLALLVVTVLACIPSARRERVIPAALVAPRAAAATNGVCTSVVHTSCGLRNAGDDSERPVLGAAVLLWLSVGGWNLLRMMVAAIRVGSVRHRARRTETHGVLVSHDIDIPFACGVFDPVVVVPASSAGWNEMQWTAVLEHERAHIARGDVLMLWVRQIVRAAHWFNPAVHWLARASDQACESACDDAVLLHGVPATEYAETVLSFVDGVWLYPASPTPTLRGRSTLESRIVALVDGARRRRLSSTVDRWLQGLAGVSGGVALALLLPRSAVSAPVVVSAGEPVSVLATPVALSAGTTAAPRAKSSSNHAREAVESDTAEALLGLGALLKEPNPILRQSAVDALRAWRGKAIPVLAPIAKGGDSDRARIARAALDVIGEGR